MSRKKILKIALCGFALAVLSLSTISHLILNNFDFTDYGRWDRDKVFRLVFHSSKPPSLKVVNVTGHEIGQANQIWMRLRGPSSILIGNGENFPATSLKEARLYVVESHSALRKCLFPDFSDFFAEDASNSGWNVVCSNPALYHFYSFESNSENGSKPVIGVVAVGSTGDIYVAAQL